MTDRKDPQSDSIPAESMRKRGVVETWVRLYAGLLESTTRTTFELVHDVRVEIQDRVNVTIQHSDETQRSMHRIARKTHDRIHEVIDDGLRRSEQSLLVLFSAFRQAGTGATSLAGETVATLVGSRDVAEAA